MKKTIGILCCALLLSGCDVPPPAASSPAAHDAAPVPFISTEAVNMSLATRAHLTRLANLVMNDPPTHAELGCSAADALCVEARRMLAAGGIPVRMGGAHDVRLIYEYMVVVAAPPPAVSSPDPAPAAAPQFSLPKPSLLLQSTPR